MNRRIYKKKKEQIIRYIGNDISQEQMIDIQAEAYYRALMKVEKEKNDEVNKKNEENKKNEQNEQKKKYKLYQEILFVINVVFWPWKINKKFHVGNGIYDSLLVLFVALVLYFCGFIMWLAGIIIILYAIYTIAKLGIDGINIFLWSLISMLIGSTFILAGKEFSKETDSNKIYAYSASIIALISCVIGVISMIKR